MSDEAQAANMQAQILDLIQQSAGAASTAGHKVRLRITMSKKAQTAPEELIQQTAETTDHNFFSILENRLVQSARNEPRFITFTDFEPPYNLAELFDAPTSAEFDALFPRINDNAHLVIRYHFGCYPVLRVLQACPHLAALITNIDFVGYSAVRMRENEERLEAHIVALCPNLKILGIEIDVEDCMVARPERTEPPRLRCEATLDEVEWKYQFEQLCPSSHQKLDTLRIVRVANRAHQGSRTWVPFADTVVRGLREKMARRGVRVVELDWRERYLRDPYEKWRWYA